MIWGVDSSWLFGRWNGAHLCICFPPTFTYVFYVCNYGSLTCFYAYTFSVIIFGACKYLNAVSFTTLLRVVRFTFMVYFQTTMFWMLFDSQIISNGFKGRTGKTLWRFPLSFKRRLKRVLNRTTQRIGRIDRCSKKGFKRCFKYKKFLKFWVKSRVKGVNYVFKNPGRNINCCKFWVIWSEIPLEVLIFIYVPPLF